MNSVFCVNRFFCVAALSDVQDVQDSVNRVYFVLPKFRVAVVLLLENLCCCNSGVLKICSGTGSDMFETHAATVLREERIHAPCLQSSERAACSPIELVSEINV